MPTTTTPATIAASTHPSVWSYPRNERLQGWLREHDYLNGQYSSPAEVQKAAVKALIDESLDSDTFVGLVALEDEEEMSGNKSTSVADKIFSRPAGTSVRAKSGGEAYSTKRYSAVHSKTGKPVFDEWGEEVTRPSQQSLAISGVALKFAARRAGIDVGWTEHDQALLHSAIDEHEWADHRGEPGECKIYAPGAVKAPLLDDSTSGGLEATPIVFDADVITTPLLTGEVVPMVDIKPISRGRRIEGASVGTPTAQWGQGDAAVGDLFDSTSQIAPLDSTVYDLSCHVLVGRNFLTDTPLAIGNLLVSLIGERMGNELERVVVTGSGTEPSGVMGASGTTSVSFGSAAPTVAKYLELLFSVPKELRVGGSFCFVSNELSYRRARAIATGVTGDERLLFGMDVENFSVFQRPYKIAPSMGNNQIFAGNLAKFRLYRRLGSSVEWTVQGENLQRRNEALLTVRQRWAGRVMLPTAFAVTETAQA